MTSGPVLQITGVGFWHNPRLRRPWYWQRSDPLPHPAWLVEPGWKVSWRPQIIGYLRSGARVAECMGFSWCRFECGIDWKKMGNCDFTDGTWLWPEGLTHYVECHDVRLPDRFVKTMAANDWQMPADATRVATAIEAANGVGCCLLDFWVRWAKAYCPR